MTVIDDTAILRIEDTFIRPSDIEEGGPAEVLCEDIKTRKRTYIEVSAKRIKAPYASIRFSHGPTLNVGYSDVMIGTVNTGYKGASPKDTKDSVLDIKKNFKYMRANLSDLHLIGKDTQEINLEDFTDRNSGLLNIANEDIYRVFGWFVRTGRVSNDHIIMSTNNYDTDYFDELLENVPLVLIKKSTKIRRTSYVFALNWFTDVLCELFGVDANHYIADEILFESSVEMAKCFREGFITCNNPDPYVLDRTKLRHEVIMDKYNVSDLSILWNKAGFPVLPTRHYERFRICEGYPKWSHYVQEVEHIDVPKVMYKITSTKPFKGALWVHGVRFLLNK